MGSEAPTLVDAREKIELEEIMRIVTEALRWLFVAFSSSAFLAAAFLILIDLRQDQNPAQGAADWIWRVTSGILVAGLLPLIAAIVWGVRTHTLKYFWSGALVLLGMLAFHYFLFAVATHSQSWYPWVQVLELAIFGAAMWFLLKIYR